MTACSEEADNFPVQKISIAEEQIITLEIKTRKLPHAIVMGTGFIGKYGDSLYYYDYQRKHVLSFDLAGSPGQKHLYPYPGPAHVDHVLGYANTEGNHWIVEGMKLSTFDASWNLKNRLFVDVSTIGRLNPVLDSRGYAIYFDWPIPLFLNPANEYFFMFVDYEGRTVNPCTDDHYLYAKQVIRYNLKRGEIDKLFGAYSPEFLKHKYLPYHAVPYGTISDQYFFLGQLPDSLVYAYTLDGKPAFCFGRGGINMDMDYDLISSWAEYNDESERRRKRWINARVRKGYYEELFFDQENNLLFRNYKTGTKDPDAEGRYDNPKRMQIYDMKAMELIADVSIPNPFRIIAQEEETYYADGGLDEINNELILYTFRLDEQL